jgi:uncharacterized protein (TIGR02246 family)
MTTTTTPAATIERFSELLSAGDVPALLDLYEDEAAFIPEPGREVRGREAIAAALEPFAALRPRMSGTVEKAVEAGDVALVANRWELEGTGPDGAPVRMAGVSADVLRRRPDGGWGVLIDDPYGVGAPHAT